MRHCMVVHAQYPIGETRVEREAQALIDRGHHVDVICLRGDGEPSQSEVEGVGVHRLPVTRRRGRGYASQALEYLSFLVLAGTVLSLRHLRHRYDVVQVHNLPDLLVLSGLVPKLTGTPVILDLHDLMPEFLAARTGRSPESRLVGLVEAQERLATRFADHVITVTDEWRETLIRRGAAPDEVSVVMNLADPRIFRQPRGGPSDDRDGFHLLYHGTFVRRYGVDLLLDAVARVRAEVPDIGLTLVGAGELGPVLRRRRALLGLSDCVEVMDMVPAHELPAMIEAADAGVVPNRSDVFTDGLLPTKLLEFVAMGRPVIAARTRTIARYFDDDMVQFFEPGNVDDLAAAIRVLARDARRRKALAVNADAFNHKYDWESTAARYATLVETITPRRDGPGQPLDPPRRLVRSDPRSAVSSGYVCRASRAPDDPAWDAFLAAIPGGHHTQTSLWGRVKASLGWDVARVVVEREGRVVGGAQLLHRRVAPSVSVGYVHRGPVLAPEVDADEVGPLVVSELERIAGHLRVRHLSVQPYGRTEETPLYLRERIGYHETHVEVAPRATVLVDVTRDPETILAAMHRGLRYNVRLSARKEITVREGTSVDLDSYYGMLLATAERQGFSPQPKRYFERMWHVLRPGGHVRLTLAEHDGVPVAGQIAVAFGDTVVNKLGVWSGEEGGRKPNEALHWDTLNWAHGRGYRHYDLEGIKLRIARAACRGELEASPGSVAGFKLRFGGDVVVMPPAHVHVPNRAVRFAYNELYPRIGDTPAARALVKTMRTQPALRRRTDER
jgi:glycosyltransferase involved in cell wall biosynthesis/lipid II:glycine glycyltransferase (peptidoglycan interpeptide bridge formation enzyme)